MKAFTKKILFLLMVFMFLFLISFPGLSQEKDSSSSWILSQSVLGIVGDNTRVYISGNVVVFINSGIPIQIQESKIFGIGWKIETQIQKIPKEISGNFYLKDGKNFSSVDVFITVYKKNSWSFLALGKSLLPNSGWNNFVWDMSVVKNIDSITNFCVSFQTNTFLVDSTESVIEMKYLAFDSNLVGISENPKEIPTSFALSQNYPNPFNPSTKIKFVIPIAGQVNLKIFNSLGQEVKTLVSEEKDVGSYEVEFDASKLPSGIYFYKLQVGSFVEIKKMILMK
ncbi:MAG: T9SS type A sorting domain-containing protein [Ignavibacteriaceae bacterium]|nr:T9SS type A sorting domain-containing protein [Ignavibacteriaceae bacterium]